MVGKPIVCFFSVSLAFALSLTFVVLGSPEETRIADAAMKGDVDAVYALIRKAVDVNSAQGDGMTALHWAAYNGNVELARTLLYAGANTKATTRLGGYTPLYMASKSGYSGVVDVMLKAGADPTARVIGGITPLMMAASSGDARSVELLTEAGADVDATEIERGQTALAFAAAFNRPEAIRALVRAGAEINKQSKEIKPPPKKNRPGQNFAFSRGRGRGTTQPKAEALKEAGAEVKEDKINSAEKPKLSAEKGRNPKGKLTPLMYAARDGGFEAVRALVGLGADLDAVNADSSTALLLATINGNLDVARYLVENGADVTIASVDGATPLYGTLRIQWTLKTNRPQPTTFYEETKYLDLMELMLQKGADPNARLQKNLWYIGYNFALERNNSSGTTAFWKAAAVGDLNGMRLLIKYGADSTISSIEGVTPLLIASGAGFHGNDSVTTSLGRMPTVKYLLEELGANVNQADTGLPKDPNAEDNQARRGGPRGGRTALHNAAGRGDNEMILYLVSKGARLGAVAKNGQTVADMANGSRQRVQPYQETLALLDILGARNNHKCVSC